MGRSSSIFQVSFSVFAMFKTIRKRLHNALIIASASTLLYVGSINSTNYLSMIEWAASAPSQEEEFTTWEIIKQRQSSLYTWLTYLPDRLYLASYTTPPTQDTLFPYPDPQPTRRSPTKRSARAVDCPAAVSQRERSPPYYFSIDDTLLYNAFHHDFGPLHIGHLYRFAVQFHDILGAPENKDKPVVFWSKADARSKLPSPCNQRCRTLIQICRSSKCCMPLGLLHGPNSILGAASRSCANSTSRSTPYALP
jgi:hypothetical protein